MIGLPLLAPAVAALIAFQDPGPTPTVGDTIWLSRTVQVPAGFVVRAARWDSGGAVEPLGEPLVVQRDDSAVVRYPAVAWLPGRHVVEVPGPLLLGPKGAVDSLPAVSYTVAVRSVLPDRPVESLPVQPAADLVPRRARSSLPVLALWALAALTLTPLHWWWRRRGPSAPTVAAAAPVPEVPATRWADAGEHRAVVAAAGARLRAAIAAQVPEATPALDTEACLQRVAAAKPDWPLDELRDLLRALDEAKFAPAEFTGDLSLAEWTDEMHGRLTMETV